MSWEKDVKRRTARNFKMQLAIDRKIKEIAGVDKPPIPLAVIGFRQGKVNREAQSPAQSMQTINNKLEKTRRNKQPVTLPSFKCLENTEN